VAVFEGGFGKKSGGRVWCFCGVLMVECVVNGGALMVSFLLLKRCHSFQLYF
jgi:hypothetical protein